MISVIIPAYNIERYIGACLDSVVSQEGVDMEIIVVDDDSTDSTRDIIRGYADRYDSVTMIHREHGGLSAVRNTALTHCHGEWITMVDGDDILAPGALKRLLAVALSDDEIDMVAGNHISFEVTFAANHEAVQPPVLLSGREATLEMLYRKNRRCSVTSSAWGKLYRASIWRNNRFREGLLYEDLEIIPRICAELKRVAVVNDIVYGYRRNNSSILHTFSAKRLDALTATTTLCDSFANDSELYRAAQSRHFSAAFNLWLLMRANDADMPESIAMCRNIVRTLAKSQIFGDGIRLKNRVGAVLQYFPFLFRSKYICKKLLAK